jgi:membrane-associated phospholipid phosphatase
MPRSVRCLVALLVLVATVALDGAVHDFAFRHVVSHEVRLVANGFTLLGTGWAASGLMGAVTIVAYRNGDLALLRAGGGGLAGVALGSLTVQVAKHIVCRARPRLMEGWGVDQVGPAGVVAAASERAALGFFHWPCLTDSRFHSFPSGHTTIAFAVAAALATAAPATRRTWLAVAGGVGASRLLLNAHFLSDVVGGAFIGWWAGTLGVRLVDRLLPWLAAGRVRAGAESQSGARLPSA